MRDLGLAVDGDVLAGQRLEVDAVQLAVECELDAVVRQSLAVQALGDAGLLEQLDRRLLEHAGADAAHHIGGAALLDDHRVDAGLVQQRAQQQPGRTGADDRDLGALPHRFLRVSSPPATHAGALPPSEGHAASGDGGRHVTATGAAAPAAHACDCSVESVGSVRHVSWRPLQARVTQPVCIASVAEV